jgi:ABC-type lipoprotein export system ATPase subunit
VKSGLSLLVKDLHKSFDGGLVQALQGVDLTVAPGERVAVVGPTGCGKSTLLSLLALLDAPDRGEILIDGHRPEDLRPAEDWRAREVGIVFQFHHLLPHLTVAENTLLPLLASSGSVDPRRAVALLGRLGLADRAHALAARLSGGERQLAALARALINDPRLVLADEPTGSVDSATGSRILDELSEWSTRSKGSLVLVTHDPAVARSMDRVIAMKDGRVVDGTWA